MSSPQGRFQSEAGRLDGLRFWKAEAHGKHLFHFWGRGAIVHVHLGLVGEFSRFVGRPPEPRGSVRMRLSAPGVTTDLIGPPTCELISEKQYRAILARLGPDPLRREFDPDPVWAAFQKRPRRPVGDALLDQRVLAGVGNIYRAEALFLTGIHPLRPSGRLTEPEWIRLWRMIRALMRRGVAQARTRTVDLSEAPHPDSGRPPRDPFYVYQAEACRRCGGAIRDFPLSGRRMFVCARCQPRRPRVLAESR